MNKQPTGRIRTRERADGTVFYQIILYLGRDYKNKKKEVYLRADTLEEAEVLMHKAIAEYTLGTFTEPSQRTLKDFIYEEYLPFYCKPHVKSSTYGDYLQSSKYICKVLGQHKLQKITTTMVQEFINDMMIKSPLGTKPLARATVVGIRRDLNVFLRKAVALKYIPSNPVEGTRIPRATKNLDEEKAVILTRQQVQELLAFVKGTPQECWYSLIIDGTLRRGEALGLLWDDVDFEKSIIKIRNNWTEGADGVEMTSPKSLSSIRSIKLTQNTMRLLKKEHVRYKQCKLKNPEFEDSNRVIFMDDGRPWLPKSFYRKYKRTLEEAGLPSVSLHSLRHFGITALISENIPLKAASVRAGHSDTYVTNSIYTHVTKEMEQGAVEILEHILTPAVNH